MATHARLRIISLILTCLALAFGGLGCGVRKGAPEWIGPRSAVVRCTVSGPNLELPALFDELPSPLPPTGLYARTLDPIALDQLGFERDRVVCATLEAPTASELDAAEAAVTELRELRNRVGKRARKLGKCYCDWAGQLDARALVPGCVGETPRSDCEEEAESVTALVELVEPLQARLASVEVPRTHWRLFGRTDRPGRFAARHEELLARHAGGSEVFTKRTPLPPYPGTKLIAALLAVDDVVALVRQDSGHALLVVREIDDQLVLDHFAYPSWAKVRAPVDPEIHALLGHLDDAQIGRYRRALAPPAQARELLFKPRKGYLVELDRAALERVDRATLIASRFAGLSYDPSDERRVLPPLLVDRFAHQVPYGTEGQALKIRARLSDEGRRWIAGVAELDIARALETLGQVELTPEFEAPAKTTIAPLFVLRGRAIEQLLFAGASGLPQVLLAIEAAAPGSLDGEIDDFEFELPTGPLPGDFPSRPGSRELRERLSIDPHELEGGLREGGRVLELELERR